MMEETFEVERYIKNRGRQLILDFSVANTATHSVAVGKGKENSVKDKLKSILPQGVGVGRGFIIDSHGKTSYQCDVIVYEEALALKFVLNEDEENAFYNCESVIAVGQIKSRATIDQIRDAMKNLKSVKELKFVQPGDDNSRRHYLQRPIPEITSNSTQNNEFPNPIFTFILCEALKTPPKSIVKACKECYSDISKSFDILVSTEGDVISFGTGKSGYPPFSIIDSEKKELHYIKSDYYFSIFLKMLYAHILQGETVEIGPDDYIKIPERFDKLETFPLD